MQIPAHVDLDLDDISYAIGTSREMSETEVINFIMDIDERVCDCAFTKKLIKRLEAVVEECGEDNNDE